MFFSISSWISKNEKLCSWKKNLNSKGNIKEKDNQNSIVRFCGRHSKLKKNSFKSILKTTNTVSQQSLCPREDSEEESFCCNQPRAAFQEWSMDVVCSSKESPGTKSLSNNSSHNGELPILDPLLSRVVLTPRKRKSLNETNFQYTSFQNNTPSGHQSTNSGTNNIQMKLTPNKLKMHQNNLFTKNINQDDQSRNNQSPVSICTRASSSDDHYLPINNSSATGSMELLWDAECLELSQNQSNTEPFTLSTREHFNDHFVSLFNHVATASSLSPAHYNGSHHLTHEQVPIQSSESHWIPHHSASSTSFHPHIPLNISSSLLPFSYATSHRNVSEIESGSNISFISGNGRNSDNLFSHSPPRNNILNEKGTNVMDHNDLEWDNYDCDYIDDDDDSNGQDEDLRKRY